MYVFRDIFSTSNPFIAFVSNPFWALMIGVVLALPLMPMKNFASELKAYFNESGSKFAIVILITGVGGAFGQVIKDTEIIKEMKQLMMSARTKSVDFPLFDKGKYNT